MKLPNGYGSVTKLSGNRRKPYLARVTLGWIVDEQTGKVTQNRINLGTYKTKKEALQALADYGANPYDIQNNNLTVAEKNEKLIKMLDAIGDLKLGNYKDNTIDTFGDAYEFLMTMYASNAGKSGGEFFTPQEVGELLAKITLMGKTEINKVYDPACRFGIITVKVCKRIRKNKYKRWILWSRN